MAEEFGDMLRVLLITAFLVIFDIIYFSYLLIFLLTGNIGENARKNRSQQRKLRYSRCDDSAKNGRNERFRFVNDFVEIETNKMSKVDRGLQLNFFVHASVL